MYIALPRAQPGGFFVGVSSLASECGLSKESGGDQCNDIQGKSLVYERTTVLRLVAQQGGLLEDASPELRDDKEVVRTAIMQDGFAFYVASDRLRNDNELAVPAVKRTPNAYQYLPEELEADLEIMFLAIDASYILEWLPVSLRGRKDLARVAIETQPRNILDAPIEIRSDKDLVRCAIQQDPNMLHYARATKDSLGRHEIHVDGELAYQALTSSFKELKYLKDIEYRLRFGKKQLKLSLLGIHKWACYKCVQGRLDLFTGLVTVLKDRLGDDCTQEIVNYGLDNLIRELNELSEWEKPSHTNLRVILQAWIYWLRQRRVHATSTKTA